MEHLPSPLTALLWDIDGTLIDTTGLIVNVLHDTYMEFTGKTLPPDELRELIGIPLERQMLVMGDPALYGTTAEIMIAAAVRRYERGRDQERVVAEAIEALIEGKRRGIPTALVTSKSDIEIEHTLPRLGISAYCDVIITADTVSPRVKPDPYPVQLALERLGVPAGPAVFFIGDSTHDIKSGNSAGVRTAAVLWGAASESSLLAHHPSVVFRRPDELIPGLFGAALAAAA